MPPKFMIVGTGRCGTGMLVKFFNEHPDILVLNESMFLFPCIDRYGNRKVNASELIDFSLSVSHADGESTLRTAVRSAGFESAVLDAIFASIRRNHRQLTAFELLDSIGSSLAEKAGKASWADKCPDGGYFVEDMYAEWPEIKFIHLIRDGIQTALSMRRHDGFRANVKMNTDLWVDLSTLPESAINALAAINAERTDDLREYLQLWGRRLLSIEDHLSKIRDPNAVMRVFYQDVVQNPSKNFVNMCDHIGVGVPESWLHTILPRIDPAKAISSMSVEESEHFYNQAFSAKEAREKVVHLARGVTLARSSTSAESMCDDIGWQAVAGRLADMENALTVRIQEAVRDQNLQKAEMTRLLIRGEQLGITESRLREAEISQAVERQRLADQEKSLRAEGERICQTKDQLEREQKTLRSHMETLAEWENALRSEEESKERRLRQAEATLEDERQLLADREKVLQYEDQRLRRETIRLRDEEAALRLAREHLSETEKLLQSENERLREMATALEHKRDRLDKLDEQTGQKEDNLREKRGKINDLTPRSDIDLIAQLDDNNKRRPLNRDNRDILCLFQLDGGGCTVIENGKRPYANYSHEWNLFYLAQEALMDGHRVAFQMVDGHSAIEVKTIYPTIEVISASLLGDLNANLIAVFGIYPAHLTAMHRFLPSKSQRRCTLVIPAVHWLESPDLFPPAFVDHLREAFIYDIDDVIVQNHEMAEVTHALGTLMAHQVDRERFVVAPCGYLPEDEPVLLSYEAERAAIRDEMGLMDGDIAIINSGGVWKWTDLDVFLESFIAFHRERPGNPLKFIVMGLRQEGNEDHAEFIRGFKSLLDSNADLLESGAIRIHHDWVEAGKRLPRYNFGADLGVNVSKASIENAQSYRQRFVEYVKAGLPAMNTLGDPMSRSDFREMMVVVEPGRKETYLAAFRRVVDDPTLLPALREAAKALRGRLRTDRVYGPALKAILGRPPISMEDRRKTLALYSGLPSFAETLSRRGNPWREAETPTTPQPEAAVARPLEVVTHPPAPPPQISLDHLLGLSGEQFLQTAYQAILKRPADPAGLKWYLRRLANGYSKSSVLYDLYNSAEKMETRENRHLVRETERFSDEEFLLAAYQRILGRAPDPNGLQHYLSILNKSGDRLQVARAISRSKEAMSRQPVFDMELHDHLLSTPKQRRFFAFRW